MKVMRPWEPPRLFARDWAGGMRVAIEDLCNYVTRLSHMPCEIDTTDNINKNFETNFGY